MFYSEEDPIKLHQKAIGARIRAIRGNRSQKIFGKLLESTQGYISDLERGRCFPSVSFLARLTQISGRSYQWILTGVEPSESALTKSASEREPAHVVSAKKSPELYHLISLLEEAKPPERVRFFKLALAFFSKSREEKP
jgi:transcriptional regulator with XRE-family HTH domain